MSACSRDAACSGNPPILAMTKPSFQTQAKLYCALRRLEISHFRKVGSRPPWSVPDIQEDSFQTQGKKYVLREILHVPERSSYSGKTGTSMLRLKIVCLLPSGREKVPDTRSTVCSGNIPLPATAREEVHTVVSDRREAAIFHQGIWKYYS